MPAHQAQEHLHTTKPFYRPSRAGFAAAWVTLLTLWTVPAQAAPVFTKPTTEELAMTSLPGYPGVPAVVLFKEEITKDDNHSVEHYFRIKVLTEEGKKYANVELPYFSTIGSGFTLGDDKALDTISARTVHADGTIIPFTGKPYMSTLAKKEDAKLQQMVFTLPDVQVGSIVEYRYTTRINDQVYETPTWLVQGDLYVKQAHFVWYPTAHDMLDSDGAIINSINWFPVLPAGAKIQSVEQAGGGRNGVPWRTYELSVHDVPPVVHEEYMPPIASFSYRVAFTYTPYHSVQDYWNAAGKHWSKSVNSFASENDAVKAATQKVIEGATTSDEKLRRIYAKVMTMENTSFTRERQEREDKADGTKVSDAADVLQLERGSANQLAELFLAMARAADFRAYAMDVPDRSEQLFTPNYMSFDQFSQLIVIVNVDGTEKFFDPGSRFCAFGHLAWQHSSLQGLRQTEGGTAFSETPGESYRSNHITRVGNLTMAPDGEVSGTIDLTYSGAPALHWRQRALRSDEQELSKELKESVEGMLPRGLQVEVGQINNVQEYEKPLSISFQAHGVLGTATGKRMIVPSDIFLAEETATFPHDKRVNAIDFHYARYVQDAVRVNLPADISAEVVPASATYKFANGAAYVLNIAATPKNVTTRRDFALADALVFPADYTALRSFYSQFETKDQENLVLKAGVTTAQASPGAATK